MKKPLAQTLCATGETICDNLALCILSFVKILNQITLVSDYAHIGFRFNVEVNSSNQTAMIGKNL